MTYFKKRSGCLRIKSFINDLSLPPVFIIMLVFECNMSLRLSKMNSGKVSKIFWVYLFVMPKDNMAFIIPVKLETLPPSKPPLMLQ